ncbi:MAG: bifunctional nicotinamide-nucleotide adenylyltransferase/Nudix hydroxylase [Hoeflea sp.]|uniref:bifunctional nicotinamide-nucleotide adenylyltransferase/Nudix hydroxylase n=1 Tax=Hoeflea sp. TaxID=1940281 RepID=UPI0032EE7A46
MSKDKTYDYLIFIGRFQPLHVGHQRVIDAALETAKNVIVLVGSASSARSVRNPFTFEERKKMISQTYPSETGYEKRLHILPLDDTSSDNRWKEQVQRQVSRVIELDIDAKLHGHASRQVGLIGYAKDHSTYYLRMFPQWGSVSVPPEGMPLSATDIRHAYFKQMPEIHSRWLSEPVVNFMEEFTRSVDYVTIQTDAAYIRVYKKSWETAPFPPVFVTVDSLCVQSGHVLLVQRGGQPGKDLWALPGGFINVDEPLIDSAVRELREETQIEDHIGRIPPAKIKNFIREDLTKVFDDPHRSSRGRTITHVFFYEFPDQKDLFKVTAADDAKDTRWVPFGELRQSEMFEDHYLILEDMLNLKGEN